MFTAILLLSIGVGLILINMISRRKNALISAAIFACMTGVIVIDGMNEWVDWTAGILAVGAFFGILKAFGRNTSNEV